MHTFSRLTLGLWLTAPLGAIAQQPANADSVAPAKARAQSAADTAPMALLFKGVRLTPMGFFTSDAVWRQRNQTADMGSTFSGIPYSNTTNGQLSEFRMSGRVSRIALLAESALSDVKISGYYEMDFLGAGVTSNSVESNSYPPRLRQFFGQATLNNGITISAGQMWTLATIHKKGALPRSEYIPATIESDYAVGYDWLRLAAIRISQKLSDRMSWAIALEEPQMTFSARGAPANIFIGNPGGTTLNSTTNYSTDVAPDVVAKIAFESGLGHWELRAVGRAFRNRIVDPTNTAGGTRNERALAGGVGFGSFISFGKMLDVTLSGLYGRGIGRYPGGLLPDATIHANGVVAPIRNAHGFFTLDMHVNQKLDVYGLAGVEYAFRHAEVTSDGKGVGYGSPLLPNAGCDVEFAPNGPYAPGAPGGTNAACNADTRALYQGNLGFWYRFYKGSVGTLQWGAQYSYTSKNTWVGSDGIQPKAVENMIFTSLRYVLP
jgi:hypothetical protein